MLANASPVRENGQIVGYQSVRSSPNREAVKAAESAYRRIREGDSSIVIRHGQVRPARQSLWACFMGLAPQLRWFGLVMLLSKSGHVCRPYDAGRQPARTVDGAGNWRAVEPVFVLYFYPNLRRDLARTDDYLDRLLSSGNLKQRLDISRDDELGRCPPSWTVLSPRCKATLMYMADSAKQVHHIADEVDQAVGARQPIGPRAKRRHHLGRRRHPASDRVDQRSVRPRQSRPRRRPHRLRKPSCQGRSPVRQTCQTILTLAGTVKPPPPKWSAWARNRKRSPASPG